jgi:RimJ/RimL family protein N-acetyltransferase
VSFELTTQRLALRPIAAGDAADLHRLWTDEPVRRFLFDGEVIPLAQTLAMVARSAQLFAEQRLGLWGVRERGRDALIGFTGFWYFRTPPALELLYGVDARHWNRGIATEQAARIIQYGFEQLGFASIAACTDVGNTASVRVLEKLGMSRVRRAVVEGLDTVFYACTR